MTPKNEKPNYLKQNAILIKSAVIAVIVLALLIPSSWIESLVKDREGYQQEQINDVSNKWSGTQLVQGPVLVLPFKKHVLNAKSESHDVIETLYILPQNLNIKAGVNTERFKSGVYDAVVYNAGIGIAGAFAKPDFAALGIDVNDVLYEKASLMFGLSDLKGLKNNPAVKIQQQTYNPEPSVDADAPFSKGLQVKFPLKKDEDLSFSYQLQLKGSGELNFLNIGKTTDVTVNSDWEHPQFNGRYLPDNHKATDKGFNATWHMLYYNRPFPQQWINDRHLLETDDAVKQASFGVKVQLPIDQYRKIMRTVKYSTLIILLTFVSLFLAELIKKQSIHLFNYILIGAAMVVYYTLLLSFSEQIGYNYAYLLSSAATIILIALFTGSLLGIKSVAILFTLILSVFYGFIFIIIQLEELSLLFGSVALFIVVALLMYFSRKINWDKNYNAEGYELQNSNL